MSLGINLACALRSTPTAVRRGALAHSDTMLVARWLPRQPLEMARVVLNTSYTETCTSKRAHAQTRPSSSSWRAGFTTPSTGGLGADWSWHIRVRVPRPYRVLTFVLTTVRCYYVFTHKCSPGALRLASNAAGLGRMSSAPTQTARKPC